MGTTSRVLVTGAGGFIGHHLVSHLVRLGYHVRGADLKDPEFEPTRAHEYMHVDLRDPASCERAVDGVDEVYSLAANMGGMGFIARNKALIMHDNVLIDVHVLEAARRAGVRRFLYASSACVYPGYLLATPDVTPLREEDAYPADSEDGYGWEKLFAERQCRHYREDYGLETRVVRFHSMYGPLGTYDGGREKAPAALCRKIALANDGDEIEVWGDGEQTRSYCYIDDCVDGLHRLMRSDWVDPINLGSDRMVTINQLIEIIAHAAGKRITTRHVFDQPQGPRGRNSDNTRVREVLGWSERVTLEEGLSRTYRWIEERVLAGATR